MGLFQQDWNERFEIVIVDGDSEDGTTQIIKETALAAPSHCIVKLISNPKRHIPVSLNLACHQANGEIIVRLDGHTYPPKDYISSVVRALKSISFKGIVGGRWDIVPPNSSTSAAAIAVATSHPIGVGNAAYRTYSRSCDELIEVDTVPFGAFTKRLWLELNGYDEAMLANEDYDFVWRARQKGYSVYMDTNIILTYFPRENLYLLWKQYYRYGYWVSHFFVKHKKIPTYRKIAPIAFLTSLVISLFFSPTLFVILLGTHFSVLSIVSAFEVCKNNITIRSLPYLVLAFYTLHLSYGIGNIIGLPCALSMMAKKKFSSASS